MITGLNPRGLDPGRRRWRGGVGWVLIIICFFVGSCRQNTGETIVSQETVPIQARGPITALSHVTVGVSRLSVALDLWVGVFGFKILARREGPDTGLAQAWGLRSDEVVDQALVGLPDVSTGRIHLVQFSQPHRFAPDGSVPYDYAPQSIRIACRDLPQRIDELYRAGYRFQGEWIQYQYAETDVREARMPLQDGVTVDLREEVGHDHSFTKRGYAAAVSLITVVRDLDTEAKFYQDLFGLTQGRNTSLNGEKIEQMNGLPPGASLESRTISRPGRPFEGIDLVQFHGVVGMNRYPLAKPPALGPLHPVFVTSSLDSLIQQAKARTISVEEHGLLTGIFGTVRACTVSTPAGLRIEIHER